MKRRYGTKGCLIDGCERRHESLGYCGLHYGRLLRTGDPLLVRSAAQARRYERRPIEERFWEKVEKTETCWLWVGALSDTGYGSFYVEWLGGRAIRNSSHRWSYEHLVGPIPDGLTIDHLCRVRNCVNPAHLEVVTQAENSRRANEGRRRERTS